jgi:hypothetical protein
LSQEPTVQSTASQNDSAIISLGPQVRVEATGSVSVVSTFQRIVTQHIVTVPEDRLRRLVDDHIKQADLRRVWLIPVTLIVTIFLTLTTADFRATLGMDKNLWHAIFIVAGVACVIWAICVIVQIRRGFTIDRLIEACNEEKKA